jgi:hypothetical protein
MPRRRVASTTQLNHWRFLLTLLPVLLTCLANGCSGCDNEISDVACEMGKDGTATIEGTVTFNGWNVDETNSHSVVSIEVECEVYDANLKKVCGKTVTVFLNTGDKQEDVSGDFHCECKVAGNPTELYCAAYAGDTNEEDTDGGGLDAGDECTGKEEGDTCPDGLCLQLDSSEPLVCTETCTEVGEYCSLGEVSCYLFDEYHFACSEYGWKEVGRSCSVWNECVHGAQCLEIDGAGSCYLVCDSDEECDETGGTCASTDFGFKVCLSE